jgi:hypothetical protein
VNIAFHDSTYSTAYPSFRPVQELLTVRAEGVIQYRQTTVKTRRRCTT